MKKECYDKMVNSAVYRLYAFIGIYDFAENTLLCKCNKDKLFGIRVGETCEPFLERAMTFVNVEEVRIFSDAFQWNRENGNNPREIVVHVTNEDRICHLYKLQIIFCNEENRSEAVIMIQRSKEDEVKYEVQDYMSAVSKLAFSDHYVLVGVRDIKRRFYENIYDMEGILELPRVCNFDDFSKKIDARIYPEDMAIYQQYMRNCDNDDMTEADFRMYDAQGLLHHYHGNTCRIKTLVGDKHLFLLSHKDMADTESIKRPKNKKEQSKRIEMILAGLSYGFDTLVHVNIKTGEYAIYEKNENETKELEIRNHFFTNAEERVKNLVHEDEKKMMLEKLSLHYLQNYFLKHDLLEAEYRKKNEEGGYDWGRMLGRRVDKNKKVKEIVFCIISVSEEYGKNLTTRLRTKYLCDILENQNEHLNQKLQKAALESKIKDAFKFYLAYEIDTMLFYIRYLYDWAKQHKDEKDMPDTLSHCLMIVCDNMDVLKDNVLSIPEIEKGSLQINSKVISMENMLHRLYDNTRIESWIRKQKLSVQMEGISDAYVEVDEYRMYQMLFNALTNEVRFSHEGAEIYFTISKSCISKSGDYQYVFCIENNGNYCMDKNKKISPEDESRYRYRLYVIRRMALLLHGDMFISELPKGVKMTWTFELKTLSNGDEN